MSNGTSQSGSGGSPGGYGHVDPNGAQTSSTVSSILGFAALVGSGSGDDIASALGLGIHSSEVFTAGLSMASLGRLSLFAVGLILVAIGIVLNVISLVHRWHLSRDYDTRVAAAAAQEESMKKGDGGGKPPSPPPSSQAS